MAALRPIPAASRNSAAENGPRDASSAAVVAKVATSSGRYRRLSLICTSAPFATSGRTAFCSVTSGIFRVAGSRRRRRLRMFHPG